MKSIFSFLILLTALQSLVAQTDTSKNLNLFNISLVDLQNIKIISVSKNEEPATIAPQTLIIITAKELIRRGYTDLEQVLHDLPGFDFSRANGTQYSQIYQRGYRTNNTERTLLLIDGVEQNDLWSNCVWLSRQYPLSNIDHIEILYGPASTIFGSNAFLGVINIITKNASDITKKSKIGVTAQTGYGTWNTKFIDLSVAFNGNTLKATSTFRYFYSDEMDLSNYSDWDYDLSVYDKNFYSQILRTNNQDAINLAMELDRNAYYSDTSLHGIKPHYSNTTKDWLYSLKVNLKNFELGFNTFRRNEGFGAWYRDDFELGPENGGKWIPNNTYFYAKYSTNLNSKLRFTSFSRFKLHKLIGKCEEYYFKGFFNGELSRNNLLDTNGNLLPDSLISMPYWLHLYFSVTSIQFRTENFFTYQTPKITILGGTDIRQSLIQGAYLFSPRPNPEQTGIIQPLPGGNFFYMQNIAAFFQINYKILKNFNFIAGGRLDYNKVRVNEGFGTIFNPKIALIYSKNSTILKLIYAEAFSDASFWTKYGITPGRLLNNPYLKPEKVKNLELSFSYKFGKNLLFDLELFNANYSNAIRTVKVSFVNDQGDTIHTTQHQSIGLLNIKGLQTNLIYRLKHFYFYSNYTFTLPYSIENEKFIRVGDIATHKANFGVNLNLNKFNINLRANYVGTRPTGKYTTISDNPFDQVDSYLIFNGAISYNFRKIIIQTSINNILNTQYFDPGVRSADGIYYAALAPQNTRNLLFKIIYNF